MLRWQDSVEKSCQLVNLAMAFLAELTFSRSRSCYGYVGVVLFRLDEHFSFLTGSRSSEECLETGQLDKDFLPLSLACCEQQFFFVK